MKLLGATSSVRCLVALSLVFLSFAHAQEVEVVGTTEEYFDGLTPFSPSVWNTSSLDTVEESRLRDYVFREAYLDDARNDYLGKEGKFFTIPTDDLVSTQRRILSPSQRLEEEESRRNYAESVTSVVVNKGVPEYMIQLLGLQKLREGVKKVEKAVAVDVVLGNPNPNLRRSNPWRLKTTFLPFQRSYKIGLNNGIWNWDVQGGWTSNKGDYLFSVLAVRFGKFLQSNTYQVFTNVGYSSLSYFIKPDMSVSLSVRKEFKDQSETPDNLTTGLGYSYIF